MSLYKNSTLIATLQHFAIFKLPAIYIITKFVNLRIFFTDNYSYKINETMNECYQRGNYRQRTLFKIFLSFGFLNVKCTNVWIFFVEFSILCLSEVLFIGEILIISIVFEFPIKKSFYKMGFFSVFFLFHNKDE